MACDLGREKLDAFVDGELPARMQQEFDAHLRGCSSCAATVAARTQLKIAVRNATVRRHLASAEFRRKMETQVLGRKRERLVAWIWVPSLAAMVAILFGLVWLVRPARNSGTAIFSEILDLHVAALASANPVDVVSTDQHTVKPWFEGKLPFAVNLPDLTNTPFTLLGGRLAYLNQTAGAELLFQFRKHRLSVFVFQNQAQWKNLGPSEKPEQRASFWVATFSLNGLRYFVIADTSAENAEQLSNLMQRAAGAE